MIPFDRMSNITQNPNLDLLKNFYLPDPSHSNVGVAELMYETIGRGNVLSAFASPHIGELLMGAEVCWLGGVPPPAGSPPPDTFLFDWLKS